MSAPLPPVFEPRSGESWRDPFPMYRALRDRDPVHHVPGERDREDYWVRPHHCIGAAAARLQARVALEEILARCPRFAVDAGRGRFAPGHFVRRYESLPFRPDGAVA